MQNKDINNLEIASLGFVEVCYAVAKQVKPSATVPEIEGMAFRILINALDTYHQHEQLQKGSPRTQQDPVRERSKLLQGAGSQGRTGEDSKGSSAPQPGTTKRNNPKKRRSKKA